MPNFKTNDIPQAGREEISQSRTVKTVCSKDSGGSKSSKTHPSRRHKHNNLYISTFNVRTLSTEEKLVELQEELKNLHWSVIGLSEVRRSGEACLTLESGHTLYYRGNDANKMNGVGFLIHKNITKNITEFRSISERVISITLKINKRYKCKIIQIYAPTSEHEDDEVEELYDEINQALKHTKTRFTLIIGDFNAKIGKRQEENEKGLGPFGLGERNERGQRLIDFVQENNYYIMNTYFHKKDDRRWTWKSPNGTTKNEIDYIITNNKNIVMNTETINSVNMGSDHRMVRSTVRFNTRLERKKLMHPKKENVDVDQIRTMKKEYEQELRKLKITKHASLNEINKQVTQHITETARKFITGKPQKQRKLTNETIILIQKRKKMRNESTKTQNAELAEINKTIRKNIRRDLRKHKNQQILQTLEKGESLKHLTKTIREGGRTQIVKITNENNETISHIEEIKRTTENYYKNLYTSKETPPPGKTEQERKQIQNVGSEEIPTITKEEISKALNKSTRGRAAGEDGILNEMLQLGGEAVLEMLECIFNKCLENMDTPADWDNAIMTLLYKKGDKTKLENYRPISLLSALHKLFTKIITERLTSKLDAYQPREQAGFRKSFSTLDHLQVVRTLIEKSNEYNITLWIALVDYEKAFDSIETWSVLNALTNCRIDSRYTTLIQNIYKKASFQVALHGKTNKIQINRGVRQGDPMSPKLFTLALEDVFKQLNWEEKGIKIEGEYLSHLRFADDVILITSNRKELQEMLTELHQESKKVGLKMNTSKTKFMTNETISEEEISMQIDNLQIGKAESYIYLGQKITLSRDNLKADLPRRISLAWSAFGRLHGIVNSDAPNTLKARTFDQCVLPVLTYGTETWAMNREIIHKLQVTQRAMERRMLGVHVKDRIPNEEIRRRSRVTDVVERICKLRWSWAGHIARLTDNRWTRRIIEWRPRNNKRSRGRPLTRWTDDIKRLAGTNWMQRAQSRSRWIELQQIYLERWMTS